MSIPLTQARILHLNDCARVADAMIATASLRGLKWDLHMPPTDSSRARARLGKALGLPQDLRRIRNYDLVHVHYGTLAYYPWLAGRPYILHLHGDDVNQALQDPLLGRVVRAGILRAGAVAFSTPDLASTVLALRSDAVWLPAPIIVPELIPVTVTPAGPQVVFFSSRWEDIKGADEAVRMASVLKQALPDIELRGVDWGPLAERARDAGVRLLSMLPRAEFLAELRNASLVIGQLRAGTLGVAELEALAVGTPLLMPVWYPGPDGTLPPVTQLTHEYVQQVQDVLAAPPDLPAAAAARDWVSRNHGPEGVLDVALEVYRKILHTP